MHRRLVNEAGDVSEDMKMGRHFHVPAEHFCLRCGSTLPFGSMVVAAVMHQACIAYELTALHAISQNRFLCTAMIRSATYSVTRIRSHAA